VNDSTKSYISLDSDVLLYHWLSVKAIPFFRLVFFQDRDILGYEVYKAEIRLYCSYDKVRDSHVESSPSQAFSSYSLKVWEIPESSRGRLESPSHGYTKEGWHDLCRILTSS